MAYLNIIEETGGAADDFVSTKHKENQDILVRIMRKSQPIGLEVLPTMFMKTPQLFTQ